MGWLIAGTVVMLAVLGVAGLIAIAVRRGRDDAEFAAWARRTGWSHHPVRPELVTRFRGEPFQRFDGILAVGNQAAAVHVVSAHRNGRSALAFEYRVTRLGGGGAPPITRQYRIAAVPLSAPRPTLEVLPNPGTSNPALPLPLRFAAAFTVRTDDPRFASEVLRPPLMSWLLSAPGADPLPFRFHGTDLLCWQDGPIDPGWPDPAINYLDTILRLTAPTPTSHRDC